jgi:hypothetical protein
MSGLSDKADNAAIVPNNNNSLPYFLAVQALIDGYCFSQLYKEALDGLHFPIS